MGQTENANSQDPMIRYFLLLPDPKGGEATLGRLMDDRSESCFDTSATPPTWQGCRNQIQRRLHDHDKIAEISLARAQAWQPAAFA